MARTVEEIEKDIAGLIIERSLAAKVQQEQYETRLAGYKDKFEHKWLRVDETKTGMKSRGLPVSFPGNFWLYRVENVLEFNDESMKFSVSVAICIETYRANTLFIEGPGGEACERATVAMRDILNGHARVVTDSLVADEIGKAKARYAEIMDRIKDTVILKILEPEVPPAVSP